MSDEKNISVQVGPGFLGTLAIVFIVLKLIHVIEWSWIWVLAPLWMGFAFVALIIVAALFVYGVAAVIDKKR